jgi:hypothetical protein
VIVTLLLVVVIERPEQVPAFQVLTDFWIHVSHEPKWTWGTPYSAIFLSTYISRQEEQYYFCSSEFRKIFLSQCFKIISQSCKCYSFIFHMLSLMKCFKNFKWLKIFSTHCPSIFYAYIDASLSTILLSIVRVTCG